MFKLGLIDMTAANSCDEKTLRFYQFKKKRQISTDCMKLN